MFRDSIAWVLALVIGAAACGGIAAEEEAAGDGAPALGAAEQEIGAPPLSSTVTGVGVGKGGGLAVQFNGAWFTLRSDPSQQWAIENDAPGTPIAATPVDTSTTRPECVCVAPVPGRACTRQEQIQECGTVMRFITDSTRTYNVSIGDSQYEVKALQTARTERQISGVLGLRMGFSADLRFEIRVLTPGDPSLGDAQWIVKAQPKRHFIDCDFDDATLELINTTGEPAIWSTPQDCEGSYSTEVQFSHATTVSLPGASEISSPINEALDEAMRQTFPTGLPYHSDSELEAYDVQGATLGRVDDETFGHISDVDRHARFFLKARDVSSYSEDSNERGTITSAVPRVPGGLSTTYANSKKWTIKPLTRDIRVRWPLLAGICGIEAFIRTSAGGSVAAESQQCFDGMVQTTKVTGKLAFEAAAGAGGYCNVILASASAGMAAGVKTSIELSSVLESPLPAIKASVNAYAEARFSAYFQVRILFWSRRWEKPFLAKRVWQRGYEHRVFERVTAPELCNPPAIDLRDMVLLDDAVYFTGGNPLPFPPPIPNGTTVQLHVALPGYPNATTDLKVRSTGSGLIVPAAISAPPGQPVSLATVTFPSNALGLNGTLHKVRFEREETVLGLRVRHVSNWLDLPRVGP